mgnify:FL=1
MLGRLERAGWTITPDPSEAHTIVVNTCSFIESAANESIDTILELSRYKTDGDCRRLIVAGCLPERYREETAGALPEVDFFLGTGAFDEIVRIVEGPTDATGCLLPDPDRAAPQATDAPRMLSARHMAYLKVAEGCSRHCTYCIIPRLRGTQKSRPLDAIVTEAKSLIAAGVKELVLVAQDTTFYGRDLDPPSDFSQLLQKLADIAGDTWIRFLYGHPESIDASVFDSIANSASLCAYFDIPIQHASDPLLKKMGRHYTRADLHRLFSRIRDRVPGAALRTTVIVGFPGETDADFEVLMEFIREVRFDHLGVFTYSDSDDLPSHGLPGHVPPDVAEARQEQLMACQLEISRENNRRHLGRSYRVLVEEAPEAGVYIGRTEFQAPEVDGLTIIHSPGETVGEFVRVNITDALEYDLIGEPE